MLALHDMASIQIESGTQRKSALPGNNPKFPEVLRFKNNLFFVNGTQNTKVLQGGLDLKPFSKGKLAKEFLSNPY